MCAATVAAHVIACTAKRTSLHAWQHEQHHAAVYFALTVYHDIQVQPVQAHL